MSGSVCNHCGCTEIDKDPARGDAVCTGCGSVLEDQIIVSEVQFQESSSGAASVIGQYVSTDGSKSHSIGISFPHTISRQSRTITFDNGKRKIQQLGMQLKLNQHCLDTAFNFFKMAVTRRLTKGRRTAHVIAACLYLVCRTEGTPHMLLDFSDLLQVNVYTLGKTYLQLSRELCINIPAIDPCLYIPRFAHSLAFEDQTHEVSMTALRLVQRMKRDWMHMGRRPSGLCGAALLVAARIHDFNRTLKDIIKVVKVCEATVRKRLTEFEDTPSSQLTIEEFNKIDLEEEHDPPSFIRSKRKAKLNQLDGSGQLSELTSEISDLQDDIEKALERRPRGIWASYAKITEPHPEITEPHPEITEPHPEVTEPHPEVTEPHPEVTQPHPEITESHPEGTEPDPSDSVLSGGTDQHNAIINKKSTGIVGESEIDPDVERLEKLELDTLTAEDTNVSISSHETGLGLKEVVEECMKDDPKSNSGMDSTSGELDLSGIDDGELDMFLLSETEIQVKTEIWMAENGDYLQVQKEKEERLAKERELDPQKDKKKRKTYKKRNPPILASTTQEAIKKLLQEKKMSNKINYAVLNDLKTQSDSSPIKSPSSVVIEEDNNHFAEIKTGLSRFKRTSIGFDLSTVIKSKKSRTEEVAPIIPATKPTTEPVLTNSHSQEDIIGEEVDEDEDIEEEEEEEIEEEDTCVSITELMGHNIDDDDDDAIYDIDDD